MTIVERREVHLALITSLATGRNEEDAVAEVAARYCLPEEAVREVIDEPTEERT